MKENILARRYAKALYEFARVRKVDPASLASPLRQLGRGLLKDRAMVHIWMSPRLSEDRKVAVLEKVADRLELPVELKEFLRVLARRRRVVYLDRIAEAYRLVIEQRGGRVSVDVYTAMELNEASMESVRRVLEQWVGREVDCDVTVEPELIGGLRVKVGDTLIDRSVAGMLERVE